MNLEDYGYNDFVEDQRIGLNLQKEELGRIITEHKERYIVITENGEKEAEITGNLRYSAASREEYPAVGDWVAISSYDSEFAVIHRILSRYSILARQATGKTGETQIISTNIDYAFLVQALDRDFNINRLERYLAICAASNVEPIILLTKCDLIEEEKLPEYLESVKKRIPTVPLLSISNETNDGIDTLQKIIEKGKTYCMLGSSGVGKSTLINNLAGKQQMKTNSISESTHKGRHVTTHRELIVLENGGIMIDNPGMREVGIADSSLGIDNVFDQIKEYGKLCRYHDCSHTGEKGCAVTDAVEQGIIDRSSYENYLKLEKESAHYEMTVIEKRKKDKEFGKMLKNYKKGNYKEF